MVYELPNNALGKGLVIGAYVLERLAHQQGGQRKPDQDCSLDSFAIP